MWRAWMPHTPAVRVNPVSMHIRKGRDSENESTRDKRSVVSSFFSFLCVRSSSPLGKARKKAWTTAFKLVCVCVCGRRPRCQAAVDSRGKTEKQLSLAGETDQPMCSGACGSPPFFIGGCAAGAPETS